MPADGYLLKRENIREIVYCWVKEVMTAVKRSSFSADFSTDELCVLDLLVAELNGAALRHVRAELHGDEVLTFPRETRLQRMARLAKEPHLPERWVRRFNVWSALLDSAAMREAAIVFLPTHPTHVGQQVPVADALGALGADFIFVVQHEEVYRYLKDLGVRPVFAQKLWMREMTDGESKGRRLGERLSRIQQDVSYFPNLVGVDRKKLWDLLLVTIVRLFPTVCKNLALQHAIRTTIQPRVILPGNVVTVEGRVAARLAQRAGIVVDSIMHGAIGGGEPLDRENIGDKFFVFGESSRDELVKMGVDPALPAVVGAPYLHRKLQRGRQPSDYLLKRLGLPAGAKIVLLLTSGPGHCTSIQHYTEIIESVLRISEALPNIYFIAKLHQKDRRAYYEKIQTRLGRGRLRVFEYGKIKADIFSWLRISTAIITTTSTVALEAMTVHVPVITVDLKNEFMDVDFIDAGATIHVKTELELAQAIVHIDGQTENHAATMRRANAFISRAFSNLEGDAAKCCAEIINSQAHN